MNSFALQDITDISANEFIMYIMKDKNLIL